MKSERVLVRIAGTAPDDWRGDDLRFRFGSREAYARGHELESGYRHIVDWRIAPSEDAPTHAYRDGRVEPLRDTPPGFRERVEPPPTAPLWIEIPPPVAGRVSSRELLAIGLTTAAFLALCIGVLW